MKRQRFPSPLGVSYFQIRLGLNIVHFLNGFRPLSGYLISKCHMAYIGGCMGHSFRPLSGYLISKLEKNRSKSHVERCFRPLSGYLISKCREKMRRLQRLLVSVPSRGILFPNGKSTLAKDIKDMCFRPLSGYLISKLSEELEEPSDYVSVPSRGILFPNFGVHNSSCCIDFAFPSPLGVSYFQIESHI